MSDPLITVIIPTRNRAHLLARSMGSVLNQTYRHIELIIVDDASTDGTQELLGNIEDDRLRVLRLETNNGAPAARNHGMAHAQGELVAFQDSDDIWHPTKLERQVTAMASASDRVGLCVCSMEVHRRGGSHRVQWDDVELDSAGARRHIVTGAGLSTQCWLARRDALEEAGGFDETLPRMQDYEYSLRITERWHLLMMNDVLVTAELQPDSISASADRYAQAIEQIVTRHSDLFAQYPGGHSHMIFRAGKVLAMEGRYREAVSWFRRALAIRPTNLTALVGMVLCITGLFPLFRKIKYRH